MTIDEIIQKFHLTSILIYFHRQAHISITFKWRWYISTSVQCTEAGARGHRGGKIGVCHSQLLEYQTVRKANQPSTEEKSLHLTFLGASTNLFRNSGCSFIPWRVCQSPTRTSAGEQQNLHDNSRPTCDWLFYQTYTAKCALTHRASPRSRQLCAFLFQH